MGIITSLLDLYVLLLIVDVILSYLPKLKYRVWVIWIQEASDLTCRPIRGLLPSDLPFDFSPFIVILLINLLKVLW